MQFHKPEKAYKMSRILRNINNNEMGPDYMLDRFFQIKKSACGADERNGSVGVNNFFS